MTSPTTTSPLGTAMLAAVSGAGGAALALIGVLVVALVVLLWRRRATTGGRRTVSDAPGVVGENDAVGDASAADVLTSSASEPRARASASSHRGHLRERSPEPNSDPRLVRAAAAAERSLGLLRSFRASSAHPMSRSLAIAIEAAASGWLSDPTVTPDDVTRLLGVDDAPPRPICTSVATALAELCEHEEAPLGRLVTTVLSHVEGASPSALAAAAHDERSSPRGLLAEAASVVALAAEPLLAPNGWLVGRALMSAWPVRSWRLDSVPLVVSPSYALLHDDVADRSHDAAMGEVLSIVEDASLRMLRSEQDLSALQRTYLDALNDDPAFPGGDASHERLVHALFADPVTSIEAVGAALEPDRTSGHAAARRAIDAMVERGWLRPTDGGDRWVADGVIATATRPFAPDATPGRPAGGTDT
ncbi:MAG: hypothetical protein U0Q22_07950 [Acidimicrobiales bacterium]